MTESQIDFICRKSAQLAAMLQITYGDRFDSFHAMDADSKDAYLWGCADIAREIQERAVDAITIAG